MITRAGIFFLTIVSALTYPPCAPAAIFEIQQLTPGTTAPARKIHPLDGSKKVLYHAASIDHGGDWPFPSVKFALARPEDLLWAEIGEVNLLGTQFPPADTNTDTDLYLVGSEHFATRTGHSGAVSAPAEVAAPEIWALMLIGAGLVWSQLRRKTRHSPIRFTIP